MDVKDFVSYETARKLKAAGFLQEWDNGGHKYLYVANDRILRISNIGCYNFVDEPKDYFDIPNRNYPCVTLYQAQKWLRDVKGIDITISVYREIDETVSPRIIKRSYECGITIENDEDLIHLPLRGLPHDVTKATLECYGFIVTTEAEYDWEVSEEDAEKWVRQGLSYYYEIDGTKYCSDPDAHSPNWCTTQEMENCITYIFKEKYGTYKCGYIEWLALLGAMKGYEQSGEYECRAVFWFDN